MRWRRRLPKSASYKVGYGRPPKKSRFKKGVSGNPKGRPKGQPNIKTLMKRTLNETIEVKENGRSRKMQRREAMMMAMVNKAIKGDVRAAFQIIDRMSVLDLEDEKRNSTVAHDEAATQKALSEASDEELEVVERVLARGKKNS